VTSKQVTRDLLSFYSRCKVANVMDFTNNSFAEFFSEHGVDIYSERYAFNGDSKAKRLRAFWQVESNGLVADILSSLLDYSRLIPSNQKENDHKLIGSCEIVIQRLRNRKSLHPSLESVKKIAVVFDAEYLSKQIKRMENSIESDPALAIGTAKELVETCCMTILNERGKPVQGTPDVPVIVKATLKELRLVPEEIPEHAKGADVIRRLTSNLASVLQGLAELRNLYGTGHGKDGTTQTLTPRHAKLAVGAAATLATFLFETYKEKVEEGT
jgi:hypothetical protein